MSLNIIIKDKTPDSVKQGRSEAKRVIRDCYKQECRQEEHAKRRIGEGTFTKRQLRSIWESDAYTRATSSHQSPDEE